MAPRTSAAGGQVSADPEAILAEMVATRASLKRKVARLKDRLLGPTRPTRNKKEKPVAQKKEKTTPSRKKASGGKKSGTGRISKKAGNKMKEVLGDMLAGAAVGAVKGAAEAALTDTSPTGRTRQSRK